MLLLDNLLDAQERLADEEAAMVRAQVGYAMAIVRLKQEMGTLLILAPLGAATTPTRSRRPSALPPRPFPFRPASPRRQGRRAYRAAMSGSWSGTSIDAALVRISPSRASDWAGPRAIGADSRRFATPQAAWRR